MEKNKPIIFQITSWDTTHEDDDTKDSIMKQYVIYICGTTEDNKKICVIVKNFTPFFYVKIPKLWNTSKINTFVEIIKSKVNEKLVDSLQGVKVVNKHAFTEFNNYKLYKFLRFAFCSYLGFKAYERVLNKKIKHNSFKNKTSFRLFESNLEPHLRLIHMRDLESCGWAKIDTYDFTKGRSHCEIEIEVDWRNINFYDNKKIAPLVIASFDLECKSHNGSFPQPENDDDPIIQIGTTFSRYGESECFYKHLVTLKSCNKIDGVTVESFNKESSVIIAWATMIKKMDPDIMTGYNILQFDYHYIMARAKKFGIENKIIELLTRIKSINAKYWEKPLKSAALGDNMLKFYDMPGRVQIDIMKVVQRDYKLASFSLDNVASEFIKEKIINVIPNNNNIDDSDIDNILKNNIKNILLKFKNISESATIITSNSYGLEVNAFIKIFFNDNFSDNIFDNNRKYKILSLNNVEGLTKSYTLIIVNTFINNSIKELFLDKLNTVYWTQAKDDLKYSDMFEMQEKTGVERAIIGKYCIQDCALCNVLINKLEVLNNNIAMANVTNVPLSYIFLKGQGVKIFSLVAKKCRERNHLIPVLKKKNKTEEELEAIKQQEKEFNKLNRKKPKKVKGILYENANINDYLKSIPLENYKPLPKVEPKIYDSDSDDENEYFKDLGDDTGYEGATVLDPVAGIHHTPITVLDYASLYPSSMSEKNLSQECLVLKPEKYQTEELAKIYDFNEIIYYTPGSTIQNKCTFVTKKDKSVIGILPEILKNLINARADARMLMEQTKNPFQKKVLDGRQLALKITANSLYGQTGAPTSPIFQKKIAASTTATGRERLMAAKRFTENVFSLLVKPILNDNIDLYYKRINQLFDTNICEDVEMFPGIQISDHLFNRPKNGYCDRQSFIQKLYDNVSTHLKDKDINPQCIYGDSVVGNEPLLLQNRDGFIEIKKIEDLIEEEDWKPYNSFKTGEFNEHFIEILCILFNIKSKYATVPQNNVSENLTVYKDLLDETLYVIDNFLIYDLIDHDIIKNLKNELLENAGLYIFNNLINQLPTIIRQKLKDYHLSYINNNIFDVRRKNLILLDKNGNKTTCIDSFINLFENLDCEKEMCVTDYKIWTDEGWKHIHKVIRHYTTKRIFRVMTKNGIVDVTEDHSLLDINKNIIKPQECNSNTKLLHSFPSFNDLENLEYTINPNNNRCISKNKIKCMKCYFDNVILGINMCIKYDISLKKYVCEPDTIINDNYTIIEEVTHLYPPYLYVYDLETSNGHFNAGIGSLTLKNTDSVFINFNILDKKTNTIMKNKEALGISIQLGILCSRIIGLILPKPQDLQYEKTLWPFIIITKKRYVGRLYTFDTENWAQKSMGLSLKRRDYAPIAKIIVGKIVNTLLNENNPEKAVNCTKDELSKILSNNYPIDKFILSKTLRSDYADRKRIVHAVLADRIAERDPGNKPQSSDRVQYVYIVTGKKLKDIKLQGERVEDPTFVLDNNLQLDYLFYITNQIVKPAVQFLEYIVHDPQRIFDSYITMELNRRSGIKSICYYLDKASSVDDEIENDKLVNSLKQKPVKKITKSSKKVIKPSIIKPKVDFTFDFDNL